MKVTVGGKDEYLPAGTKDYVVTGDTTLELGFYKYSINGDPYYVKGATTKVETADVTKALDLTAPDGMYYLWEYSLDGAPTTINYLFATSADSNDKQFVVPGKFANQAITTGFWKVTTAATGKTTANAVVYKADGTAVAANTELDADTAYFAKVKTKFTWTQSGQKDAYHTVEATNTVDFDFDT